MIVIFVIIIVVFILAGIGFYLYSSNTTATKTANNTNTNNTNTDTNQTPLPDMTPFDPAPNNITTDPNYTGTPVVEQPITYLDTHIIPAIMNSAMDEYLLEYNGCVQIYPGLTFLGVEFSTFINTYYKPSTIISKTADSVKFKPFPDTIYTFTITSKDDRYIYVTQTKEVTGKAPIVDKLRFDPFVCYMVNAEPF